MEKIRNLLIFLLLTPLFLSANIATVKSFNVNSTSVVIGFDKEITQSDINSFYLQLKGDKNFRRVVDIKARFLESPKIDSKTAVPTVRIAQFSPDTTRVVLSHKKMFNISVRTDGSDLIIDIDAQRDIASATTTANVATNIGAKKVIVIDAGHGGRDTGAIGVGGVVEKNVVLTVSKMIEERLKSRGFSVVMTRDKDQFVELQKRTEIANKINADLFISIHANASPAGSNFEGIETYFLSPARSQRAKDVAALENNAVIENMGKFSQDTFLNFLNREVVVQSNKLAIDLQRGMLFSVRDKFPAVQDNGVREGPFWVLVGAQMPAVLVEIGYMSHRQEVKRITNKEYQQAIADGIALGVESYFINLYR